MVDLPVSKELMVALLGKLAGDDHYRSRFEHNAEAALEETGFPSNLVVHFPTEQRKLADKAEFEAARKRLTGEVVSECLCIVIPALRLDFGDASKQRSALAA